MTSIYHIRYCFKYYNYSIFILLRQQTEEREQHGLAIMQMVVVLVFVVCNLLAMLSNVFELFGVNAVNVTFVSNFLVTLNHSVNLFVYCAFGERFREELKRIGGKIRRKIRKCLPATSENKSEDIHFESYNTNSYSTNSRVRRSFSLPENILRRAPRNESSYSTDYLPPSLPHKCNYLY